MTTSRLVEVELNRIDWSSVREAAGSAENIPHAVRALLSASNADEAKSAYWRLENHVVVQGQLFEAAPLVVPPLVASLIDSPPRHVRIAVLDLLFQIVSGEAHLREVDRGNENLSAQSHDKAREGLWILYRELLNGESDAARDVIEVIETDGERLLAFLDRGV